MFKLRTITTIISHQPLSRKRKYKLPLGVLSMTTTTTANSQICLMTKNDKQRVTLFLDPSLLKQAKMQAIIEELSLTALIEKALAEYLPEETMIRKADA